VISIVFIFIAAALNAFMDRIETIIAFDKSIFHKLDTRFWCKSISAHYVIFLPMTKYRADAWHIAKTLMLLCIGLAIVCYSPIVEVFGISFIDMFLDIILLTWISWICSFNVFYNHIFKRK